MNKVFGILIGLVMLASCAFATDATIIETENGYIVTGATGATAVDAGRIRVRMLAYEANTANNICTITSGGTSGESLYLKGTVASSMAGCMIYFGEGGVVFDAMTVTLAEATDHLYIYT